MKELNSELTVTDTEISVIDDFPEEGKQIHIKGTIRRRDDYRMTVEDEEGAMWVVSYTEVVDFIPMIGTLCTVYGTYYSAKTVEGDHLILVDSENDHISFADGTEYVPGTANVDTVMPETQTQIPETTNAPETTSAHTTNVPDTTKAPETITTPTRSVPSDDVGEMVWIQTKGGKNITQIRPAAK